MNGIMATDGEYDSLCDLAPQGKVLEIKDLIGKLTSSGELKLNPTALLPDGQTRVLSPLVLAAQHGKRGVVEYLLSLLPHSKYINHTATIKLPEMGSEVHHCTALNAASIMGHLAIVKLLLESGAFPDIPDCLESTPFCEAIFHRHLDVAECLHKYRANINAPNVFGWTPLHVAVSDGNPRALEFLIAGGADLRVTTPEGYTALHIAAGKGKVDMVTMLLQHSCSPQHAEAKPSKEGYVPCPLFLAAVEGYGAVVRKLTKLPNPDVQLLCGIRALELNQSPINCWREALELQESLEAGPPEYLPPLEAYGHRTEVRNKEELDQMHDTELIYQSLIMRERYMGCKDPQLFWSLSDAAQKLVHSNLPREAERLLLRAIELAGRYRLPNVGKGYILPQTAEAEFGRWIEKQLATCLVSMIHLNHTPHFRQYIEFCWELLSATESRVKVLHSKYGCEQTSPRYLVEGILLLFHIWLYHNSQPKGGEHIAISVQDCEELGRKFVSEHLWLDNGPTLLHLAVTSEKDLYFYLAGSPGLLKQVQEYTKWSTDSLLVRAILQWGGREVINSLAPSGCGSKARPLHVAVKTQKSSLEELLTTLLAHGAHLDAVDSAGKTAHELVPVGILSPSTPMPLACQASLRVIAEGIPYEELSYIPPRVRAFIQLHDQRAAYT